MRLMLKRRIGQRVRLKFGDQILWVVIEKKGADLQLLFEGSGEFQILREELVEYDD